MQPRERAKLLGVGIDIVDWAQIEQFCRDSLVQAAPKVIVTVNGEIILAATKNKEFRDVLNRAELSIPDSTNVVWMARLKGYRFPYRTPGSELIWLLCEVAEDMNKSVFLLGGQTGVAEQTAEKLKEKYPKLDIVGTSSASSEDQTLSEQIRRKNPDIVFVAYGAPKQELWISRNKETITAKIFVGVGGTFDMISGRLKRAPEWLRRLRLEWLWRLYLQPGRVIRVFKAVVVFPIRVLFS